MEPVNIGLCFLNYNQKGGEIMDKKPIKLSNGHEVKYVIASGSLAFDGKGWPWERPLVALGFIRPELFTVVLKSLTLKPRVGNLKWYHPWTCVRLLKGGAVNKVGLTNPGIENWCREIARQINFAQVSIVLSLFGDGDELVIMATEANKYNFVAIEVNDSCPNSGHGLSQAKTVIENVKRVKNVSRHPIIVKVSVSQDYLAIAKGLEGVAEAVSINSVPWEKVFPDKKTPIWKLEKKVGGGGSGVSGSPAKEYNWIAVYALAEQGSLPVIAPSIMKFEDMDFVRKLGASAVSFGAIHLPDHDWWYKPWKLFTWFTNPCKPTNFVLKEKTSCKE